MNSPNQLSFLPDDYLARKARRRTNAICAALFLVIASSVVAAFVVDEEANRRIETRHTEVARLYTAAAEPIAQLSQMQDEQRRVAHQAEMTASLLEKVPRSNILAELTNARPDGVDLLDLKLNSKLRQPPPAPPKTAFEQKKAQLLAAKNGPAVDSTATMDLQKYDVTLKLTAVAPTDVQAAQYMRTLSGSPLFQDVNLVVSEDYKQGDERLRKFELEMSLKPDADVTPGSALGMTKTAAVEVDASPQGN